MKVIYELERETASERHSEMVGAKWTQRWKEFACQPASLCLEPAPSEPFRLSTLATLNRSLGRLVSSFGPAQRLESASGHTVAQEQQIGHNETSVIVCLPCRREHGQSRDHPALIGPESGERNDKRARDFQRDR